MCWREEASLDDFQTKQNELISRFRGDATIATCVTGMEKVALSLDSSS